MFHDCIFFFAEFSYFDKWIRLRSVYLYGKNAIFNIGTVIKCCKLYGQQHPVYQTLGLPYSFQQVLYFQFGCNKVGLRFKNTT